ncbi:MAG: ABC transporter ATP-binding protein [Lachnospirales bacterium]
MSKITIKNLHKSFEDKKVLDNINLIIEDGKTLALLGASGCGKTTLLNCILGLLNVDSGDIYFNENRVNHIPMNKRLVSIVFQENTLFPHMNVYDNIAYGLKIRKVSKTDIDRKVKEMLELTNLTGYEKKYPSSLSGGEKQRVAISRALVVNPNILLLDEAFNGLDVNIKNVMINFIVDLQKKLKFTMILVTHKKEEAFSVAHKVALIIDGKIAQIDSPKNIYENPKTKETAMFFEDFNIFSGRNISGIFSNGFIEIKNSYKNYENCHCIVNFKDVIFSTKGIKGTISDIQYLGINTIYFVVVKSITIKVARQNDFYSIGDEVFLQFNKCSIVL